MPIAIEARNLAKEYSGGVWGAVDVSFDASYGEITVLLGPNGAGKTTTIGMLATILRPTRGFARVGSFDVVREARQVRRIIALCPQDVSVDPNWTPLEAVVGYLSIRGLSFSEARKLARYWLEVLDLWSVRNRIARALSGGQRKRIAVAMVLASGAPIVFLDEPTVGLDVEGRYRVWRALREFAREGRCIVMTTHDMKEAEILADRVVMLSRGRVVAQGSPEELVSRYRFRYRVIAKGVKSVPSEAPRVLELGDRTIMYAEDRETAASLAARVAADSVVIERTGLEDVYLEVASS